VQRRSIDIDGITIGPEQPLTVIAGPCVLERPETNEHIGTELRDICRDLGLPFIFKASYDKANRSSIDSKRGPGVAEGLAELGRLKDLLGVPVTTDVHLPEQAAAAAKVTDLLQVPAFLCRQTDLLAACAATGRAVNVKKGQFLSPAEMAHVVEKLRRSGCERMMLTERGTFFGYNRLVNDFTGLGDLMALGWPVCFDVTHSTQLPGGGGNQTAGRPERGALLGRAAAAAGVDAVFIECHPRPEQAWSDAATMQPLSAMAGLLAQLHRVHTAARSDQRESAK